MFVTTKATVKLANVNTVHAQVIGVILCHFPNCPIIYSIGPVYYCLDHPYNTISSGALKFYVVFQKVVSESLEHSYFFDPQYYYWRYLYQTQKKLDYLQIKIV